MWSVCSTTGSTSTPAKLVCRRPWLSNGLIRTSRWVPDSTLSVPYAYGHLDREGGRLEAGLLGVRGVVDLGRVAVPLGPAQVHPQQHLGEVGRVHPAGAGPDGHQRLAGVVLAGEQGADLHLLDRLGQRRRSRRRPRRATPGVGLGLGQLQQHPRVVQPGPQPLQPVDLAVDVRQPRGDLLRLGLVVPEVRRGRLLLQLGLVPAQPVEVEDVLDVAQGGVECLELFGDNRQRSRQSRVLRAAAGPLTAGQACQVRIDQLAGAVLSQDSAALW